MKIFKVFVEFFPRLIRIIKKSTIQIETKIIPRLYEKITKKSIIQIESSSFTSLYMRLIKKSKIELQSSAKATLCLRLIKKSVIKINSKISTSLLKLSKWSDRWNQTIGDVWDMTCFDFCQEEVDHEYTWGDRWNEALAANLFKRNKYWDNKWIDVWNKSNVEICGEELDKLNGVWNESNFGYIYKTIKEESGEE